MRPASDPPDGPWPFPQPRNEAVLTTAHVVRRGAAIVFAARFEEDGSWQFLSADPFSMQDALLLALCEVHRIDPSIGLLADLPAGWAAERSSPSAPWRRYQRPDPPDEEDDGS